MSNDAPHSEEPLDFGFEARGRLELVQEVVEYIKNIPTDQPIRITAETWTPGDWIRSVTHIGVASGVTRY